MEGFLNLTNSVKGVEVLHFEEAEIEKYKGSYEAFGAIGPLDVLYFKDYNRFVLQINDWKFPLLKRLPIILTSNTHDTTHRTYVFPALNGFTYQLKIHTNPNIQALNNFETILSHNSLFSVKGEDTSERKREISPDDKLVRHHNKETGVKEIITANINSIVHKVKAKAATLTTGTKNLTSTKKRINIKSLKNKNYKKTAKSTFKKDFFSAGQKVSQEFFRLRKENKNLIEAKDINGLMKTTIAPMHFVSREDLEEAIFRNKDLVVQGNFAPIEKEKKTYFQNVKESISNIKEMATTKKDELIGGTRAATQNLKEEKLAELDPSHHSAA